MDIKWFEDFLSIANTRSFSRAAEERHITQSALSRRIQSLEQWLDVMLIDRSNHPLGLTPAGEQFKRDCWQIVHRMHQARADARARGGNADTPIRFGLPHALARYHFLPWLRQLEARTEVGSVRVKTDNVDNNYDDLINNQIDFLMCYQHAGIAGINANSDLPSVRIARERTLPVTAPNTDGTPLYHLPGSVERPLPCIGYGPDAPIGWNREMLLMGNVPVSLHLKYVHEASIGELVKEMVLDKRGMAYLPERLVVDDLASGKLVLAGEEKWFEEMEIWAYRSIVPSNPRVKWVWDAIRALGEGHPRGGK